MTPTEALNQLTMCALGKCAVCVHSEEGECAERIFKARDILNDRCKPSPRWRFVNIFKNKPHRM